MPPEQSILRNENEIVIYVDNRELSSRVVAILEKRCVVREKQLDVADYLLSEHVAVERKTSADFLQSMTDGRLFEQLARLSNAYDSPLLIIEGSSLFEEERNIH